MKLADHMPPPKRKRGGPPARWFISEQGVRWLATQTGQDPDEAVKAWRGQWEAWLAAERAWKRSQTASLHVVTGQTGLKPEDADSLRYTTEAPG